MIDEKNFMHEHEKRYDAFRGQIQHEDSLFNQRITWILAMQAFLLFPYISISLSLAANAAAYDFLRLAIPAIGMFSTIFAVCGCFAAHLRIKVLAAEYKKQVGNQHPPYLPAIRSPRNIHWFGAVAPYAFLSMFFLNWFFCLCLYHKPFGTIVAILSILLIGVLVYIGHQIKSSILKELELPTEVQSTQQIVEGN